MQKMAVFITTLLTSGAILFKRNGGHGQARTADLTIISRAL